MSEKRADPETELEVNEAILEYIIYAAIVALLHDAKARAHGSPPKGMAVQTDIALQMVGSFLLIFRANHPEEYGSTTLQFRLRLLKFVTLFTRRLLPSGTGIEPGVLETIRKRHQARANAFLSHYQIMPGLDLATTFGPESFSEPRLSYGSPASLSLLDTLPSFMAVSAAQNVLQGSNVTELWMELAAHYMTQAVLEQYLVYGVKDSKAIEEAFAYGFRADLIADADSDNLIIANMFWGGEHEGELMRWKEIRNTRPQG